MWAINPNIKRGFKNKTQILSMPFKEFIKDHANPSGNMNWGRAWYFLLFNHVTFKINELFHYFRQLKMHQRKCPSLNRFWFMDECMAYQFLSFGLKVANPKNYHTYRVRKTTTKKRNFISLVEFPLRSKTNIWIMGMHSYIIMIINSPIKVFHTWNFLWSALQILLPNQMQAWKVSFGLQ